MKVQFPVRVLLLVLVMSLSLVVGGQKAFGQSSCIGNCLQQYDACQRSAPSGEYMFSVNCQDIYNACVEQCMA
jgi:hypothetical protein